MKIQRLTSVLTVFIFALALLGMQGCGQKASGDETSAPPESLYSEESSSETSLDQTEEVSEDIEQSENEFVSFPYVIKASIRSNMPEFTFTLDGYTDTDEEVWASIVTGLTVKDEDGKTILDISFQENGDSMGSDQNNLERPKHPLVFPTALMELEDINFDDTLDITVIFRDYRNVNYYAWIWDDTENAYRYEPEYAMLVNPLLNPEHKMILSQGTGGAAYHTFGVFQYIDGILTETNRASDINISPDEIGSDGHDMHLTEEELVDGEWVTVIDKTYNVKNHEIFGEVWMKPPWDYFHVFNPATGAFEDLQ